MQFHRPALLAVALLGTCRLLYAQEPAAHSPALQGFIFGDIDYVARDRAVTDGFVLGQMVAHGNARLSERVSFFGEFSATSRPDSYAFEVERAILRYDFADQFKLSVGRYHTPISYWNTAYHHGLWLQTSVGRPEIIKVGGRFMPVHFVGAVAEGTFTGRALSFSYEAGIGNGRGVSVARAGDAGDFNRSRAGVLSAQLRPGDLGLQLGGSMYFDRPSPAGIGISYDERITTGHVVWDRGAPELIAEYANVRHEQHGSGEEFNSNGWYAHFGYRLPGALSQWKPYARFERLDADAADLAFGSSLEDYRAWVGGLRFDFDALAALKAEYRRERFGAASDVNGLYLQAAFAVPLAGGM